jgi:hypothetical protein
MSQVNPVQAMGKMGGTELERMNRKDEMTFQLVGNGADGQIYSSSCWMRIEIESLLLPILRGGGRR